MCNIEYLSPFSVVEFHRLVSLAGTSVKKFVKMLCLQRLLNLIQYVFHVHIRRPFHILVKASLLSICSHNG